MKTSVLEENCGDKELSFLPLDTFVLSPGPGTKGVQVNVCLKGFPERRGDRKDPWVLFRVVRTTWPSITLKWDKGRRRARTCPHLEDIM